MEILKECKTKVWCIVRTIANHEKKVSEKLIKEGEQGDLIGKIDRVVVPIEKSYYLKNGKKIHKDKIMYPGYVFVETTSISELNHFIKYLEGVSGLLTDRNKKPQIIPNADIERMVGVQKEINTKVEKGNKYLKGENIIITNGPFKSFNGVVEKIDNDKVKIIVMVFGRETIVDLHIQEISKI